MTNAAALDLTVSTADLHPRAPRDLVETGVSHDLVLQLALKHLHLGADFTGLELAARLGLEYSVIEPVLESLKHTHDVTVSGGAIVGGASFRYRITDAGRRRALLYLEQSHYVGPVPVPLTHYRDYMDALRGAVTRPITKQTVLDAFSHMVLSEQVVSQVGPAVAAGHSMFIYGAPGNGKTMLSQAIHGLMPGEIAIPYAIEVEGQIVRVFDPVSHQPVPDEPSTALIKDEERRDARWVRCRRPVVMVGGELTLEALDLTYSPGMGFYTAPVQVAANGGLLIVDDFGRQRCTPTELLNRWIVPLESRIDFLTLQTGQKFVIPFNVFIVFATNLRPATLVDEAFLRRIQYKVLASGPSPKEFRAIFDRYCQHRQVRYDPTILDDLLERFYPARDLAPRGCHPRDLIEQALAYAAYHELPRELTRDLIEVACNTYFVSDDKTELG